MRRRDVILKDSNDLEACIDEVIICAAVSPKMRENFLSLVRGAVRGAWRTNGIRRKSTRARNVRPYFVKLRAALAAMQTFAEKQSASSPDYHGEVAGTFLSAVIAPVTIEELIEAVDHAEHNATTKKSTRLPRGRSALASPQFSLFVHRLYFAALTFGGNLTCSRSGKIPIAKGSFVDALDALRPCLPGGFIPNSQRALQNTFDKARRVFRDTE